MLLGELRVDEVYVKERTAANAQKLLYLKISRNLNGIMGVEVCERLPKCMKEGLRGMFPSHNEEYMGYKQS